MGHALHDLVRLFHPMQRGIGEDGIESQLEGKPLPIHHRDRQVS